MSIRIAAVSDVPQMLSVYGPYVKTTSYTFEYTVPTVEEFTRRFLKITAQFPWLVWEEGGTVLGYAYGSPPFSRQAYSWCAEVSIYLSPAAQGRGIGRALYRVLEEILAAQGYQTCYAIVTSTNEASLAFHRALGFAFLAEFPNCGFKLGHWTGVTWLEKRLKPVEIPSQLPCPWPAFVKYDKIFTNILDKMTLS